MTVVTATPMQTIGKYEIHEKLGAGGFAVVYKGYDPYIKRAVAIKICFSRDDETRQRFHREAEVAGRLVHRNITTVYDFGNHRELPYLVEEYLPGEDLARLIRRGEPRDLKSKLSLLRQIALGLGYAHDQGVIHRDIKPSNIRVLEDGSVKIMDFGTAKLTDVESRLTQAGMTLGTVAYLAPERLAGHPGGLNSDIFSFGVVAYELLLCERPFKAKSIPALIEAILNAREKPLLELMPACPPGLARMIHTCLEKDPTIRFSSCGSVSEILEAILAEDTATEPAVDCMAGGAYPSAQISNQISGLLDRARQLLAEAKVKRAQMLLDEVLDLDPRNSEGRRLRGALERKDNEDTLRINTGAPEDKTLEVLTSASEHSNDPAVQRRRRIAEAVGAVERSIHQGELRNAAETLRFAVDLLGDFPQVSTLRQHLGTVLRGRVKRLRQTASLASTGMAETMQGLFDRGLLTLPFSELFREWIEELDPENFQGRNLLAEVKRLAGRNDPMKLRNRNRRLAEAVASIEALVAEGKVEMARDALRFAIDLFGRFEQVAGLEHRIEQAMNQP